MSLEIQPCPFDECKFKAVCAYDRIGKARARNANLTTIHEHLALCHGTPEQRKRMEEKLGLNKQI